MANTNLFEKYGIKEVANVTFYRIEKKEETYESQREISAATILKSALKLQTVYPIDENGKGKEDGFEAYVFSDATIVSDEANEHNHEFSYEKQILNAFAKNQNLISKTGARYSFTDTNIFGNGFEFSDQFVLAPNSTERVVILGLSGSMTIDTYSVEEVNTAIKALTYSLKAKAFNVVYKDYAELIVSDEMGYFDPNQLGTGININGTQVTGSQTDIADPIIAGATMWNKDNCKSINDAILALRQKKTIVDVVDNAGVSGVKTVSGGYNVSTKKQNTNDDAGIYQYNGEDVVNNKYTLASVLKALTELSIEEDVVITGSDDVPSNRAIYVKANTTDISAKSYIYLLRNTSYKKLSQDTAGIFKFTSKATNETIYYKDEIFAGTEYLALVIVGTNGLIFKVGRHGERKIEKMGWMVNQNGYISAENCDKVVENGLIHMTDMTIFDEAFDAVCSVSSLKVRKTKKIVDRYIPVLFLDTLKVSTIEQTAESTDATGGRGNSKLITWDYGKEITLALEDALYSPASMSAMLGSYEGGDFTKGIKDTKRIDRTEKCTAARSFIVPAGNSKGVPSEGETSAQAVYIELATMQPYQDGAPIAEGETYLKWTRSVAYGNNSLGTTIEISADKFPGTYRIVGETFARNKDTGEDQRFQFIVPQAKMSSEQTITLEAEGEASVFSMNLNVLRPDNGVMMKLVQFDVVENTEENDGSTMVKDTENLNLLDSAEMFRIDSDMTEDAEYIGATEY